MKKLTVRAFLIFIISAGLSGHAEAKPWTVDYANSHLAFIGMQGSNQFQGAFKNFKANIDFDPDHPETGKILVTVDIASATTGDEERDSTMPQNEWFNVAKFPQAQFASDKISKTGPGAYVAQGSLMIKGVTQPVTLPFTLVQDGDHWRAQGKTTVARNAFHIGDGQWANEQTVKFSVDVIVDLAAKPGS